MSKEIVENILKKDYVTSKNKIGDILHEKCIEHIKSIRENIQSEYMLEADKAKIGGNNSDVMRTIASELKLSGKVANDLWDQACAISAQRGFSSGSDEYWKYAVGTFKKLAAKQK